MNVTLVSIDNLRFDCVGYQKDKRGLKRHDALKLLQTDTMDRIAEHSLCFSQCISTNTYTTASHASIFTGLYPPKHGVRAFFDTKLDKNAVTLAQVLSSKGYRTVCYTDAIELFSPLGLAKGFDHVLSGSDQELFKLLRSMSEEDVFLFCHFMDVHEPYLKCECEYEPGVNNDFFAVMKELYRKRGLIDASCENAGREKLNWRFLMENSFRHRPVEAMLPLYVKGVSKFDNGRFRYVMDNLSGLGFAKDALLTVLSDHGEGRCYNDNSRKGFFGHGGSVYENVIRVPLMISHPDIGHGMMEKMVSTVDLAPTLLSMLSIDLEKETDGLDLLACDRDKTYSELWISSKDASSFVADYKKKSKGGNGIEGDEWPGFMMCQMSVRTEDKKYVRWNRGAINDFIQDGVKEVPNEEFMKRIYRDILGRFEDSEGIDHFSGVLDRSEMTRRQVLAAFLLSAEYRSIEKKLPKHSLIEFKEDVDEDFPRDVSSDAAAMRVFDYMDELESHAVVTEKIHEAGKDDSQAADEDEENENEKLMDRLKELGYF